MIPPNSALDVLQLAILLYFAILNVVYFVFTLVAFFDLITYRWRVWRGDLRVMLAGSSYRPISILVPCFNEERTIAANLRSLLTLRYPEYEIVVVNDGSTDTSLEVLRQVFRLFEIPASTRVQIPSGEVRGVYRSMDHPHLVVVDKVQGGKSDALNAGINISSYPLFCSIDADSLLESDALLRIARVLQEDVRIVAAGGIIRVLNGSEVEDGRVVEVRSPRSLLALFQSLEYVRGFLAGRRTLSKLNALLIVSGAFGLFRKSAVVDVGGYRSDTVGEDMELITRLQHRSRKERRGWRIVYVPDPVCWTQVPAEWGSLLRQRDRWHRGLLETLWIHKTMFLNPRYGVVGMVAMPYYVFLEALGPLVEVVGYALIPILLLTGQLEVPFAVLFFVLAVMYGIILSVTALIVDDLLFVRFDRASDLAKMILGAFFEFIGYRQILAVRRSLAFITVFGRRKTWGRMQREHIQHDEERKAAAPAA